MPATLSLTFTAMAKFSDVLPPYEQEHVAQVLEDDAEVMSNTELESLLAGRHARAALTSPTFGQ
jgi:hypothetical protein